MTQGSESYALAWKANGPAGSDDCPSPGNSDDYVTPPVSFLLNFNKKVTCCIIFRFILTE